MKKSRPRFKQSREKAAVGELAIGIQKLFPLRIEIFCSRLKPLAEVFSGMRDGMVSDSLNLIYFPLPKSACTLFATFVALHSTTGSVFDPQKQGVHQFRYRRRGLQLRNMALIEDGRYFKFTVIRDPYSRLVSAYLDKLVKPIKAGKPWATDPKCGDHSFEKMIESLCIMRDAQIEKHFRPQAAFIRNVPMDHIGVFDDLSPTFKVIHHRYGIDVEKDIFNLVHMPKRTRYARSSSCSKDYVGNLTAREIASLKDFPSVDCFYNDRLRAMVSRRYREDLEIYNRAKLEIFGANS